MYKRASRGLQVRAEKNIQNNGRKKSSRGRPKTKAHVRLEATATDVQLASWRRYIEDCRANGTTPSIPRNIQRMLTIG